MDVIQENGLWPHHYEIKNEKTTKICDLKDAKSKIKIAAFLFWGNHELSWFLREFNVYIRG